jgi:hypothetical protein
MVCEEGFVEKITQLLEGGLKMKDGLGILGVLLKLM